MFLVLFDYNPNVCRICPQKTGPLRSELTREHKKGYKLCRVVRGELCLEDGAASSCRKN